MGNGCEACERCSSKSSSSLLLWGGVGSSKLCIFIAGRCCSRGDYRGVLVICQRGGVVDLNRFGLEGGFVLEGGDWRRVLTE